MGFSRKYLSVFLTVSVMAGFVSSCSRDQGATLASSAPSNTIVGGATPPSLPSPPPASPSSKFLVWSGAGVNAIDLGCLVTEFAQNGVQFQLVNETDISALTPEELSGYLGLIFPDGSTSTVLSQLSSSVVTIIQDAVKEFGFNLLAIGGSSGVPTGIGLPAPTSSTPIYLQIIEIILDGISVIFPPASIISQFIDSTLPAIVQWISGSGSVSLYAPQSSTPSCGASSAVASQGGTTQSNPLGSLISSLAVKKSK